MSIIRNCLYTIAVYAALSSAVAAQPKPRVGAASTDRPAVPGRVEGRVVEVYTTKGVDLVTVTLTDAKMIGKSTVTFHGGKYGFESVAPGTASVSFRKANSEFVPDDLPIEVRSGPNATTVRDVGMFIRPPSFAGMETYGKELAKRLIARAATEKSASEFFAKEWKTLRRTGVPAVVRAAVARSLREDGKDVVRKMPADAIEYSEVNLTELHKAETRIRRLFMGNRPPTREDRKGEVPTMVLQDIVIDNLERRPGPSWRALVTVEKFQETWGKDFGMKALEERKGSPFLEILVWQNKTQIPDDFKMLPTVPPHPGDPNG